MQEIVRGVMVRSDDEIVYLGSDFHLGTSSSLKYHARRRMQIKTMSFRDKKYEKCSIISKEFELEFVVSKWARTVFGGVFGGRPVRPLTQ